MIAASSETLSVWCVADGRAGITNQTRALAAALSESARRDFGKPLNTRELVLTPRGPQLALRADLWPAPLAALPPAQRIVLRPPWPDVWIAAGRRSIPYSRLMHRLSGGRTLVVQTQDPRVPLDRFDLVIPPEHDGLAGSNVFPILGPPVWFSEQRVSEAQRRFAELKQASGHKVLVSIGGDSRHHRLTLANAAAIEAGLGAHAEGRTFWITVSRRTPEHARKSFRRLAERIGAVFWENEERDGPNPYLAFLSLCDVAMTTCESANLIADPAFFAKPIHLLKLDGASPRFDRLHQGFIARGAARWFDGDLETWKYPPIREAGRAANAILQQLAGRGRFSSAS